MATADVGRVVQGFMARERWPYGGVAGWVHERRELLPELLSVAVERLERSSPAVSAVVGLVSEQVLSAEVEHAMTRIAGGAHAGDSQAADLVAAVSLQAPHLLTSHLGDIWDLGVNRRSYYASWPWRAATDEELRRLFAILRDNQEDDADAAAGDPVRAAACLMQTRDPDVLREVRRIGVPGPQFWVTDPRWVGFDPVDEGFRPVTAPGVYHLRFPDGALRHFTWEHDGVAVSHPTWDLPEPAPTVSEPVQFGGVTTQVCPSCHGPVHRLLRLPSLPADLGVTACPSLELVTCLTCLGYVHPVLYATHTADGTAEQLLLPGLGNAADTDGPEAPFVVDPFPEVELQLTVAPDRWRAQDWALSNNVENLNRVGGEPCWIQGADYPTCLRCSRTMPFIAQLDTLDFTDHGEWMWGSGGLAYIFWCNDCRHSATLWQCT